MPSIQEFELGASSVPLCQHFRNFLLIHFSFSRPEHAYFHCTALHCSHRVHRGPDTPYSNRCLDITYSQVIPLASQSGGRGLEDEEPSKTCCLTWASCLHLVFVITSEIQLIRTSQELYVG